MLLNALTARPAAVVATSFEPDRFCALIAAHGAGTVFVVPATAIAVLGARAHERHDVSSVLLCSEPTAERCHRRLVCEYLNATWGDVTAIHL